MTTEIAVFNRLGVALATDSAVTITGGGKTKIFNSADKLFELSSVHPVAVMVNGNMDCIGVPWEVVIKDFRTKHGDAVIETIEQWLVAFITFVDAYPGLDAKTLDLYAEQIVDDEISHIQVRINERLNAKLAASKPRAARRVDVDDLTKFYIEAVEERSKEIGEEGVAESVVGLNPADIIVHYKEVMRKRIDVRFEPYRLEPHEVMLFEEMFAASMMSKEPREFTSGIVVAGFGATSIYPEVVSIEVSGKIIDKLKTANRTVSGVANGDDAGKVISFAQTDVIDRLLGGADPLFVRNSSDFIESAVRSAASSMEELFRPKRMAMGERARRLIAVDAIVDVLTREYVDSTVKQLRKKFTQNFDRMVSMMPKQELIELAEALVSITAVERKASTDEGTVGGPIDVALITKHDGFVWVKRKHYFAADLNPNHFWRKYANAREGKPA